MYNRLFTKILDSSIWLESSSTRIVWITLLAAMDETGYAHFSAIENLANRARISVEDTQKALECLLAPDPNSANPENDGKRVERVPGGFMILNANDHRKTLNREIEREQTRLRVQKHRILHKSNNETVTGALRSVTSASASASSSKSTCKEEDSIKYCTSLGLTEDDGHWFYDRCVASGWKNAGKPIVDWQATVRAWKRSGGIFPSQKQTRTRDAKQMSAYEIKERVGKITAEINAIFKKNGSTRVPLDGIDDLKRRRDELQKSLLS